MLILDTYNYALSITVFSVHDLYINKKRKLLINSCTQLYETSIVQLTWHFGKMVTLYYSPYMYGLLHCEKPNQLMLIQTVAQNKYLMQHNLKSNPLCLKQQFQYKNNSLLLRKLVTEMIKQTFKYLFCCKSSEKLI